MDKWDTDDLRYSGDTIVKLCHGAAAEAGWWNDPKTGESTLNNPLTFSNKLMLIVSELAEAMEADRKDLMDDKITDMHGRVVELADAVIRIGDVCGAYNLPLGEAIARKMEFNAQRPDHKLENRLAAGGKSY